MPADRVTALADALDRAAQALRAALDCPPLEHVCFAVHPQTGEVALFVDTPHAYHWANAAQLRPIRVNFETGDVVFAGLHNEVTWVVRFAPDQPERQVPTDWTNAVQQTSAFPAIPAPREAQL